MITETLAEKQIGRYYDYWDPGRKPDWLLIITESLAEYQIESYYDYLNPFRIPDW